MTEINSNEYKKKIENFIEKFKDIADIQAGGVEELDKFVYEVDPDFEHLHKVTSEFRKSNAKPEDYTSLFNDENKDSYFVQFHNSLFFREGKEFDVGDFRDNLRKKLHKRTAKIGVQHLKDNFKFLEIEYLDLVCNEYNGSIDPDFLESIMKSPKLLLNKASQIHATSFRKDLFGSKLTDSSRNNNVEYNIYRSLQGLNSYIFYESQSTANRDYHIEKHTHLINQKYLEIAQFIVAQADILTKTLNHYKSMNPDQRDSEEGKNFLNRIILLQATFCESGALESIFVIVTRMYEVINLMYDNNDEEFIRGKITSFFRRIRKSFFYPVTFGDQNLEDYETKKFIKSRARKTGKTFAEDIHKYRPWKYHSVLESFFSIMRDYFSLVSCHFTSKRANAVNSRQLLSAMHRCDRKIKKFYKNGKYDEDCDFAKIGQANRAAEYFSGLLLFSGDDSEIIIRSYPVSVIQGLSLCSGFDNASNKQSSFADKINIKAMENNNNFKNKKYFFSNLEECLREEKTLFPKRGLDRDEIKITMLEEKLNFVQQRRLDNARGRVRQSISYLSYEGILDADSSEELNITDLVGRAVYRLQTNYIIGETSNDVKDTLDILFEENTSYTQKCRKQMVNIAIKTMEYPIIKGFTTDKIIADTMDMDKDFFHKGYKFVNMEDFSENKYTFLYKEGCKFHINLTYKILSKKNRLLEKSKDFISDSSLVDDDTGDITFEKFEKLREDNIHYEDFLSRLVRKFKHNFKTNKHGIDFCELVLKLEDEVMNEKNLDNRKCKEAFIVASLKKKYEEKLSNFDEVLLETRDYEKAEVLNEKDDKFVYDREKVKLSMLEVLNSSVTKFRSMNKMRFFAYQKAENKNISFPRFMYEKIDSLGTKRGYEEICSILSMYDVSKKTKAKKDIIIRHILKNKLKNSHSKLGVKLRNFVKNKPKNFIILKSNFILFVARFLGSQVNITHYYDLCKKEFSEEDFQTLEIILLEMRCRNFKRIHNTLHETNPFKNKVLTVYPVTDFSNKDIINFVNIRSENEYRNLAHCYEEIKKHSQEACRYTNLKEQIAGIEEEKEKLEDLNNVDSTVEMTEKISKFNNILKDLKASMYAKDFNPKLVDLMKFEPDLISRIHDEEVEISKLFTNKMSTFFQAKNQSIQEEVKDFNLNQKLFDKLKEYAYSENKEMDVISMLRTNTSETMSKYDKYKGKINKNLWSKKAYMFVTDEQIDFLEAREYLHKLNTDNFHQEFGGKLFFESEILKEGDYNLQICCAGDKDINGFKATHDFGDGKDGQLIFLKRIQLELFKYKRIIIKVRFKNSEEVKCFILSNL